MALSNLPFHKGCCKLNGEQACNSALHIGVSITCARKFSSWDACANPKPLMCISFGVQSSSSSSCCAWVARSSNQMYKIAQSTSTRDAPTTATRIRCGFKAVQACGTAAHASRNYTILTLAQATQGQEQHPRVLAWHRTAGMQTKPVGLMHMQDQARVPCC